MKKSKFSVKMRLLTVRLFVEDGLHRNEVGYDVWSGRLADLLESIR